METVIVERRFEEPVTPDDLDAARKRLYACSDLHRADLKRSYLSGDGQRVLCLFEAPDAESVRIANRNSDNPFESAWPGSIHGPHPDSLEGEQGALVIVERSWDEPVVFDDIQAVEDQFSWCLEQYRIKFLRSYFSRDRKRMICLYTAPDAEAVRTANRTANMPAEAIYPATILAAQRLS